jgi:hypothetical protein
VVLVEDEVVPNQRHVLLLEQQQLTPDTNQDLKILLKSM